MRSNEPFRLLWDRLIVDDDGANELIRGQRQEVIVEWQELLREDRVVFGSLQRDASQNTDEVDPDLLGNNRSDIVRVQFDGVAVDRHGCPSRCTSDDVRELDAGSTSGVAAELDQVVGNIDKAAGFLDTQVNSCRPQPGEQHARVVDQVPVFITLLIVADGNRRGIQEISINPGGAVSGAEEGVVEDIDFVSATGHDHSDRCLIGAGQGFKPVS